MKILITGNDSYVGNSIEKWLKDSKSYYIKKISLRQHSWKAVNFSEFDVVIHLAGIAHIKETSENSNLYYQINRDLAYEVAKKAKIEGVKQFIFFSSMSVYGIKQGVITKDTPLKPTNSYGKSKLQAEQLITNLVDNTFKLVIIRPPMIYGKYCKGNYPKLAKFAMKSPVFPLVGNKRSMIHVDNLSEFVKLIIEDECSGLYFPQNKEYVNTSEMVKLIANVNGKNIKMTKIFNPIIKLLKLNTINKVFGDLVYEKSMSYYTSSYYVNDFESSILETERKQ